MDFLKDTFHDIPEDETRRMLGSAAAEVFGFDTEALQPLVDRIGPTPADLGQGDADLSKWDSLKAAGRSWITGVESMPAGIV